MLHADPFVRARTLADNHQLAVARRGGFDCAFCKPYSSVAEAPHLSELQAFMRRRASSTRHPRPRASGFKLLNGQAGLELSHAWDRLGFWRGNDAVTRAFEQWLERESAKLIVLERQGLSRLVSNLLHDARVAQGLGGPNGSAWCADDACVARLGRDTCVVPLVSASSGKGLAAQLDDEVLAWTQLLGALRGRFFPRMLYLTYEELVDDAPSSLRRVLRFLGVRNDTLPLMWNATRRMSRERLSDSVANKAEVERALAGTAWELPRDW